ncbi:MAG TPA: peptide chain release factor N(5)-glutamine methyltransferase [Smithellaceae bacterium]|jgi:release factor glutamine methyltransferase|nr:peptide chain release factor N(5)-glutamine methyltransferase [Smithellaceae bacterium]HOR62848.1 peptide chain release factor N(5)-glutamine methyltransferase [Smithellaceae bacterium]HOU56719.1 peptide chain release factor N(5)-glutamine methyltransferase [Smithellaceae bacterium]HQH00052.1 peptide chain release factor N(5)-glutamine methyltransferase [Smithellaceae bacterium]HQH05140.1 peptide chain release factor N(5)-glutamine methyltransferase [Smithellaceae bacterium]
MTIRQIIFEATQKLEKAGIPSARLDAEVLLAFLLRCDRLAFFKNPENPISKEQRAAFDRLIERRTGGEPVAYMTGRKAFWSFALEVNPAVLIPRPDTEVIVEEALAVLRQESWRRPRILDIGTGSGAIALALACEVPGASITATDISEAALQTAQKNAAALNVEPIVFLKGDLFEPVEGRFDLIVSNPPYIGADEYQSLPPGVKNFEPEEALRAGQTGLEFYEKLIYQAHGYLAENGWLLLEIGARQKQEVRAIYEAHQDFYERIDVREDYAGLPRVIKGRRR